MDIGRTRSRPWRGCGTNTGNNWQNQRGGRANVANTGPKSNDGCFKCGEIGHYACNCPRNQSGAQANLIDFDPNEETYYEENTTSGSRVSHIHSELDAMTFDEKQQLAKELGQGEDQDFHTT
jgi:hypothetical protein